MYPINMMLKINFEAKFSNFIRDLEVNKNEKFGFF